MSDLLDTSPVVVQTADLDVLLVMAARGGGFVRQLGEAWLLADVDNSARLMGAFRDLYDQYADLAALTEAMRPEFSSSDGSAFA